MFASKIIEIMPPRCGVDPHRGLWYKNLIALLQCDEEEKMSNERIFSVNRPARNAGKRGRRTAGYWMGDGKDQVVVEAVITGTAPYVVPLFPGFDNDPPSVSEPAFAMCLRAAAAYVSSPLSAYLPTNRAGDFLPFIQLNRCGLACKGKITNKRFRIESSATLSKTKRSRKPTTEEIETIRLRVLGNWTLAAEIVFALFPGVTEANIRELIAVAGTRIGLGKFRPQQEGAFGSFTLTEMKVIAGAWPSLATNAADELVAARAAARNVLRDIARASALSDEEEDGEDSADAPDPADEEADDESGE